MNNKLQLSIVVENAEEIEKLLGIKNLKQEIENFKNQIIEQIDKKFLLNINIDEYVVKKDIEIKSLKEKNAKLEMENSELKNELSKFKEEFKKFRKSPLIKLMNKFKRLSNDTKEGLKNIFSVSEELPLFISGILNMEALWDYAAYLRREHKDEEFEKLKEIFDLIFNEYAKIKEVFFQEVNIGDEFDIKKHIRDNRSEKMSGKISKIILKGYLENDIIIKKTIVKVG